MLINDEARMTNDKGMTKSEARKPRSADDSFRNGDTEWLCVRTGEEMRLRSGRAEGMNNKTKVVGKKTEARHLLRYWSFVIRSSFVIRISSF